MFCILRLERAEQEICWKKVWEKKICRYLSLLGPSFSSLRRKPLFYPRPISCPLLKFLRIWSSYPQINFFCVSDLWYPVRSANRGRLVLKEDIPVSQDFVFDHNFTGTGFFFKYSPLIKSFISFHFIWRGSVTNKWSHLRWFIKLPSDQKKPEILKGHYHGRS